MDVSPASLRSAGTGVANAADALSQQWQSLLSTAQGMGDIFGDDMVGGLIGASYSVAQDIAGGSFASALEGFTRITDGLKAMADLYDTIEQANTDTFRSPG